MVPEKVKIKGDGRSQRANPRYLILVELRKRVWKKVGWEHDGKSFDPWGGKILEGEVVGGGEEEPTEDGRDDLRKEQVLPRPTTMWNDGLIGNEGTGVEDLDAILGGDPMDMFQWDEWESLTSDFFAN